MARPADPGYITGVSVHPGYWEDEVVLDGKKKLGFLPGIRDFEKGLKMEGEVDIDGHNVLVYFAGGSLDFGGDPHELHFTPLNAAWDSDGTYQDIVVYQAPGNTTQGEYGDQTKAGKKTGSGTSTSGGASHQEGGFMGGIYFPDATIKLRCTITMCATGPIVANRVNQEGSSSLVADSSAFVSTQLGPRLFQLIE